MVKKVLKTIGVVFLGLISLVIVICLLIILNGTNFESYHTPPKSLENWMEELDDDILVKDIIMPGSHDAGSYGMVWLGETQHLTIEEQLEIGTRYFDLRVNKLEDDYVIFHSIINGTRFLPILESIKSFIETHPTETLLLDFQHFEGNSQEDVYKFITEYLYNNKLLVVNDKNIDDIDFIENLTLKESRGKCIIFWGDRSSDLSDYIFLRNNDGCSYDNMCLNSYYETEYHAVDGNYLCNSVHPIYFENIKQKEKTGIFVLQCQLTDTDLIFGPWSKEKASSKEISEYIVSLKDNENLEYVNVIMRDFLNYDKCKEIIDLNKK